MGMRTLLKTVLSLPGDVWRMFVTSLPDAGGNALRRAYYRRRCRSFGAGARIAAGVRITQPARFSIGDRSILYENCHILSDRGSFEIGQDSHLAPGVHVNAVEGRVCIGDNVAIGPNTVLLSYTNDYEAGSSIVETYKCADVTVGDDVFIGALVVVMPGVSIGEHAVVGAGAVVTKDVPPRAIVVGVPARKIGERE